MVLNIRKLIDDAKCFETVRELRWPDGVTCPDCGSRNVTKQGHDDTQPQRQRYAGGILFCPRVALETSRKNQLEPDISKWPCHINAKPVANGLTI